MKTCNPCRNMRRSLTWTSIDQVLLVLYCIKRLTSLNVYCPSAVSHPHFIEHRVLKSLKIHSSRDKGPKAWFLWLRNVLHAVKSSCVRLAVKIYAQNFVLYFRHRTRSLESMTTSLAYQAFDSWRSLLQDRNNGATCKDGFWEVRSQRHLERKGDGWALD